MSDPRRPAGPGSIRSGARLDRIQRTMMRRIAPAQPPVACRAIGIGRFPQVWSYLGDEE